MVLSRDDALIARAVARAEEWSARRAESEGTQDPRDRAALAGLAERILLPAGVTAAGGHLRRIRDGGDEVPAAVRRTLRTAGSLASVLPAVAVPLARRALRAAGAAAVGDARSPTASVLYRPLGERVFGAEGAARWRERAEGLLLSGDAAELLLPLRMLAGPSDPWSLPEAVAERVELLRPLLLAAARGGTVLMLDADTHRELDLTVAVLTALHEDPERAPAPVGIALYADIVRSLPVLRELAAWARSRDDAPALRVHLDSGAFRAGEEGVEARVNGWAEGVRTDPLAREAALLRLIDIALAEERLDMVVAGADPFILSYAKEFAEAGGRAVTLRLRHDDALLPVLAGEERVRCEIALSWPEEHDAALVAALALPVSDADIEAGRERFLAAAEPSSREEEANGEDEPALLRPPAEEELALTAAVLGIARGSADAAPSFGIRSELFVETAVFQPMEDPTAADRPLLMHSTPLTDPALDGSRAWAERILTAAAETAAPEETPLETAAGWGRVSGTDRGTVLLRASGEILARRDALIRALLEEREIPFDEAERAVAELVDRAVLLASLARELDAVAGAVAQEPREPVEADSAAEALGALAAGAATTLRTDAPLVAGLLREALTAAGLPEGALRVSPADPAPLSRRGSVIVTASADLDAAIQGLVHAAFRTLLAPLVILVDPVGHAEHLARGLVDAVEVLAAHTREGSRTAGVAALPAPPMPAQERALTALEPGEAWLIAPERIGERLWTPGIRTGLAAGSRFSREAAGIPVLGILHAPSLRVAIELQNALGGEVAALYSRDPAELAEWLRGTDAPLLQVNRSPADARTGRSLGSPHELVRRARWAATPGTGSSTLHLRGLDSKIVALVESAQPALDYPSFDWLRRGALSDAVAWDREFGRVSETAGLGVERHLRRFRPADVAIRAGERVRLHEVLRTVIAGVRTGSALTLSLDEGLPGGVRLALGELRIPVFVESRGEWEARAAASGVSRARVIGEEDPRIPGLRAFTGEVTTAGRVELLVYLREQRISISASRGEDPSIGVV